MLFRRLLLLFMLVCTSNVLCKEDSSSVEMRQSRAVQTTYPFNHPPSAEIYSPIPVAIVYEDQSEYPGRSDVTTEAVKITKNVQLNATTEQVESTTVAIKNTDAKTKVKLVPRPRALNNLEIPVAVVYESDSNSYQNNYRTKTDTTTDNARTYRNSRRKQKAIVSVDTPNEYTTKTTKPVTEKLQQNIETSTFGKRIGGRDEVVPIIEMENYVFSFNGNFHYRYEGGDGTKAHSEGKLRTIDNEAGEAVKGGFSYTDKEGNDFSISYTADENGYRPVGAHLPTPPPIPPAIARALAYLATATPEPVTKRPVKP